MEKSLLEDVIQEILLRLPVKSLLHCRCVCKSWCNLIKCLHFIERHHEYHSTTKRDERILVVRRGGRYDYTHQLFFYSYESLSVVAPPLMIFNFHILSQPCNGLMCLVKPDQDIVLCNPALREFKVLPPSLLPRVEGRRYKIIAIGFDFDSYTKDYKVVTILEVYPPTNNVTNRVEIYCSNTNSWRESYLDIRYLKHGCSPGTLFDGTYHWIFGKDDGFCILCFDMSTEVFREMELPDDHYDLLEHTLKMSVTVLNESLALFVWRDLSFSVDVWMMYEYGVAKSWKKLIAVERDNGDYVIQRPLFLWKNEAMLVQDTKDRLFLCDLDTCKNTEFEVPSFIGEYEVVVYQESLISIK